MFKFGLILGVIGFQNRMRDFYEPDEDIMYDIKAGNPTEYPGVEYDPLDHFIGNMITIFRMSMGDNDLPAIVYLGYYRAILFWCVWLIICYFTFIIFFNFLIAEACKSYEVVTNNQLIKLNRKPPKKSFRLFRNLNSSKFDLLYKLD